MGHVGRGGKGKEWQDGAPGRVGHPPPDATGCRHLRAWPDPHLPGEGAAGRDEGPRDAVP